MRSVAPRERDVPSRQLRGMRAAFPSFAPTFTRRGGIAWNGTLQPTEESPAYRVAIYHEPDRSPKVRVTDPLLRPGAPHLYSDGSLCLYWREDWHWAPHATLAETIIPWTALWLYYYEIWLITGEWLGPSSPHSANPQKETK